MFDGGTGGGIGCDEIWPEPMPPEGCCQPAGGGGGGATIVGGGSSGLAGDSTIRVVPSCVQKASQSSSKVRLQVGQRFISFVRGQLSVVSGQWSVAVAAFGRQSRGKLDSASDTLQLTTDY